MADIGAVAFALLLNDGLIGAAPLQIIMSCEPHVFCFRRVAWLLKLGERRGDEHSRRPKCERSACKTASRWTRLVMHLRQTSWLARAQVERFLPIAHQRAQCSLVDLPDRGGRQRSDYGPGFRHLIA